MIRHPVTKANVEGIVQHNLDGDLDARGYIQIDKLLKHLELESIDRLYSSDAYRCRALAEKIGELKGLPIVYSPLFREINNGDWFGKKKEAVSKLLLECTGNARPPNGESLTDLAERAKEGFNLITNAGGERAVLVSHGWFLKTFLGNHICMSPNMAISRLKFSNCAVSEIRIESNSCLIEYLNNRDYLKNE